MRRKTGGKSPVTSRALVQRIRRALSKREELIHASRGAKATQELGAYYTVDLRTNFLISRDVDIEELGRDLGVLKPWEELEEI